MKENKNKYIHVKCTPKEHAEILMLAQKAKKMNSTIDNISDFVRDLIDGFKRSISTK